MQLMMQNYLYNIHLHKEIYNAISNEIFFFFFFNKRVDLKYIKKKHLNVLYTMKPLTKIKAYWKLIEIKVYF